MASRLSDAPAIAIFPWGDVVEDFLGPLGLELSDFVETVSGGWLFGYVEALRFAGFRPVVICASAAVQRSEHRIHRATGVSIWIVPGRSSALPYSSRRSGAQWWRTPWRAFAAALLHERCTRMLVQEYEYARFDALAVLGRLMKIDVFATFQGGDLTLSRLEGWIRPWSLRLARGLAIASTRERDRLHSAYRRLPPMADIPNPLAAGEWRPGSRLQARARLGLPPDLFLAVTHGRIDIHRKGLDVLVEAWRRFDRPAGGRRLVLVGAGQDDERFRALLDAAHLPSIDWQPRYTTDRSEIRTWLNAADVYVSASRVEGMPVAPLEAMASGLPVVCSRAQGLPDIFALGEGHGGILVPCDDPEAIAVGLRRLERDPSLAAALGVAGQARVDDHFSIEAVGQSLRTFLASEIA
jgi:glycosyltransferase involved in cell wall biosynthesis